MAAGVVVLHAALLALLLASRLIDRQPAAPAPLLWVTIRELSQRPRQPESPLPAPALLAPAPSFPLPLASRMPEVTTPWISNGVELTLSDQDCEQEVTSGRRQAPCAPSTRTALSNAAPLSPELMAKFAHDKEVDDAPLLAPCFSAKLKRFSTAAC